MEYNEFLGAVRRSFGSTDALHRAFRDSALLYPKHNLFLVCYADAELHLVKTGFAQKPRGTILLHCPSGSEQGFLRGIDWQILSRRYRSIVEQQPHYPAP